MDKNSFLPPLQKSKKQKNKNGEDSDKNVEYKKQILKFYPQIQSLEKHVISLKQQIPMNLSKVILDLKQETHQVLEEFQPSVTEENNNSAQKELSELEKRLNEKIQESLKKNKDNIKERMKEIVKNTELMDRIKECSEIRMKSRISSLEHLIDQKYKMFNSHVAIIENNLSKLVYKSKPTNQKKYINQIKTDNDINTNLSLLISNHLDELDEKVKRRDKEQNETQAKIDAMYGNNENDSNDNKEKPKDFTDDYEDILRKIHVFKKDFIQKTEEIERKSETIEQHTNEIEQMATDLLEATNEIASHSTETESLIQDLLQSVEKITKKIDNNIVASSVDHLSKQIKASQGSIKSSIEKLNDKLHQIDISIPFNIKND